MARVSKEAYDSCNSTNPISLQTTGPANFTLDVVGGYYFIGTLDRHCSLGQKLAIKVIDSSAGPSPSPPPPSTTPAPSRAPMTFTVGDGMGWLVPPLGKAAYDSWAYNKVFIIGDTLGNQHTRNHHPFSLSLSSHGVLFILFCSFQLRQWNAGRGSGDKGSFRSLQHQHHHRHLQRQSSNHHTHHCRDALLHIYVRPSLRLGTTASH